MEPEFSFDDLLRVGAENSRLKAEVARLTEWQAVHSIANGCNSRTADALGMEVDRLKTAIKNHRAQRADDRCIEDDDRLYETLGDGIKCDRQVGSKEDMLKNCARFIDRRCEAGKWPTYAELEAERDAARAELKAVRIAGGQPLDDANTESQWVAIYEAKREHGSKHLIEQANTARANAAMKGEALRALVDELTRRGFAFAPYYGKAHAALFDASAAEWLIAQKRAVADRVYRYCFEEYFPEGSEMGDADAEEIERLAKGDA